MPITNDEWARREQKLKESVEGSLDFYRKHAWWARFTHRSLGIVTLVCTILAPLFILSLTNEHATAAAAGTFSVFGMGNELMAKTALVLSLVLALSEGLRRMFRPQERWAICTMSAAAIKRARESFRDKRIGLTIGSPEWLDAIVGLREEIDRIESAEAKRFFDGLNGDNPDKGGPKN